MLFDQLSDLLNQRIGADTLLVDSGRAPDKGCESAVIVFDPNRGCAFATFNHELDLTVLLLLRLQDAGNRAYSINSFGRGFVDRSVVLGRQKNRPVGLERQRQGGHGTRTADFEGDRGERKNHHIAYRYHWATDYVGRGTV